MSDSTPPVASAERPDVIIIMTDQERAAPSYESDEIAAWRRNTLSGAAWFEGNAVNFTRHYTGSLACVPSRPTIFTGQYPDCLLYTSPSPRDATLSRMPSSA